jgi:hypothetical protein
MARLFATVEEVSAPDDLCGVEFSGFVTCDFLLVRKPSRKSSPTPSRLPGRSIRSNESRSKAGVRDLPKQERAAEAGLDYSRERLRTIEQESEGGGEEDGHLGARG